jgi:hypothetical protein
MRIHKNDGMKCINKNIVSIDSFHDYNNLFIHFFETWEKNKDILILNFSLGGENLNFKYSDFKKAIKLLKKKFKKKNSSEINECVIILKGYCTEDTFFSLANELCSKDTFISVTDGKTIINFKLKLFLEAIKLAFEQFENK